MDKKLEARIHRLERLMKNEASSDDLSIGTEQKYISSVKAKLNKMADDAKKNNKYNEKVYDQFDKVIRALNTLEFFINHSK